MPILINYQQCKITNGSFLVHIKPLQLPNAVAVVGKEELWGIGTVPFMAE